MIEGQRRLSIGLPVFNGERFLAAAIRSVLDGSYQDFELIVSDNGSTDGTERIARDFADGDGRIRYVRNATNIGPAANFNQAFRLSRGEYFKWLAYDDLCGPDLLARCIDVLDSDSSIVLCSARYVEIDEVDRELGQQPYTLDLASPVPHVRLGELMCSSRGHPILFGVIRSSVLRQTHLLAKYHGSDRALIAELVLHGRIWELPEVLWSSREHPDRSPHVRTSTAGWEPRRRRAMPPHLASAAHLARILATAPISPAERVRCTLALVLCLARRTSTLVPALGRELLDVAQETIRRPAR